MNLNLIDALREIRRLGGTVTPVPATGEVVVKTKHGKTRVNVRRKDTPKRLMSLVHKLWRERV